MCRWAERVLCFGLGSLMAEAVPTAIAVLLHRRAMFYPDA